MSRINSLGEKMESLLLEIDTVCRKHKIEYYLMEEALIAAIRGRDLPKKRKVLSIAVHGKDIDKLIRVLKKEKNRAIESLHNNPAFPGFYLRYVDLNTLLFDTSVFEQKYDNCCIGIHILVLCPYQKEKEGRGKVLEAIKQRWAKEICQTTSQWKHRCLLSFSKLAGFDRRFVKMMNRNHEKTEWVEFYTPTGEHFVTEKSKFGKGKDVSVGEKRLKVPRAAKQIARLINEGTLLFGMKNEEMIIGKTHIINFNVSGEQFISALNESGMTKRSLVRKANQYLAWKDETFMPVWNKRKRYYTYYFLTKERFGFYDELCGEEKKEILFLLEKKKYDDLEPLLASYIKQLLVHEKQGYCLYFDRQIYIAAIMTRAHMLLSREKVRVIGRKNVRKLKNYTDKIPQPYLKPLYAEVDKTYTPTELEGIRESIREELDERLENLLLERGYSEKENLELSQ